MEENVMIERLIRRQEIANEKILKEIGKTLKEIGYLNPSELYTISQQLKYGESLDKIIKILSEVSNKNQLEIYKMLEADARINLNQAKKYYIAKGIDFIPFKENQPLQNLVKEIGYVTLKKYQNIANTTGLTYIDATGNKVTKPLKQAYYEIIDEAILNVLTGKETFQKSLKKQLKTLGENGIQSIEYESGIHRRIDSALRMNLNDGLNELAISQQQLIGNQFGNNGWEVTTHAYPAPDHEDIQGHLFDKENFDKMQSFDYMGEFKDVNGYTYTRSEKEHIRPIGELNCKHWAFAIVLGIDEPRYTQEELNKINEENKKGFEFEGKHYSLYEGTQLQRHLELEIRKNRETEITAKAGGNEELLLETQKNIDYLISKYYKLSKISGLKTRMERTKLLTQ